MAIARKAKRVTTAMAADEVDCEGGMRVAARAGSKHTSAWAGSGNADQSMVVGHI